MIDGHQSMRYAQAVTDTLVHPLPVLAAPEADACCGPAPGTAAGLPSEVAARYAAVLKALADPHRLRMLSLIAAQPATDPLCVCEIEGEFGLSQPTISHHLKVLREAGLVTVTKRGLWHHYAPRPEGLAPARQLLDALAGGADGGPEEAPGERAGR
jgi:ArsR family transcriptional regulator, arsenate/arsenite/antimonite-responsive transcriptional repressor